MWNFYTTISILMIFFIHLKIESASITNSKYYEFIKTISENDKPDFITFSLLTAVLQSNRSDVVFKRAPDVDSLATLNQMLYEKFQNIDAPRDFSTKLLHWVESEVIEGRSTRNETEDISSVCFPSGCVDPGDIGSICCPF